MEKFKWFSYVLLLTSSQGVFLIIILRKTPRPNKRSNFYLSGVNGKWLIARSTSFSTKMCTL